MPNLLNRKLFMQIGELLLFRDLFCTRVRADANSPFFLDVKVFG